MKKLVLSSTFIFISLLSFGTFEILNYDFQKEEGINISYNDMMKYLENFYTIEKSKLDNDDRYMGTTEFSIFEMVGNKDNLKSTTLVLINPKSQQDQLQNSAILLRFLKNALPEWETSNEWAVKSLSRFAKNLSTSEMKLIGKKNVKMVYHKNLSMYTITVKKSKI